MDDRTEFPVKVQLSQDEVRKLFLCSWSVDELHSAIQAISDSGALPKHYVLQYKDDEDEWITVTADHELEEAHSVFRGKGKPCMKLFVVPTNSASQDSFMGSFMLVDHADGTTPGEEDEMRSALAAAAVQESKKVEPLKAVRESSEGADANNHIDGTQTDSSSDSSGSDDDDDDDDDQAENIEPKASRRRGPSKTAVRLRELEGTLATAECLRDKLQSDNQVLRSECDKLTEQNKDMEAQISELTALCDTLQASYEQLKAEAARSAGLQAEHDQQLEAERKRVADIEAELSETHKRYVGLVETEAKKRSDDVNAQLIEKQKELDAVLSEKKAMDAVLSEKQKELDAVLSEKQKELDAVQAAHSGQLTDLRKRFDDVTSELEQSRQEQANRTKARSCESCGAACVSCDEDAAAAARSSAASEELVVIEQASNDAREVTTQNGLRKALQLASDRTARHHSTSADFIPQWLNELAHELHINRSQLSTLQSSLRRLVRDASNDRNASFDNGDDAFSALPADRSSNDRKRDERNDRRRQQERQQERKHPQPDNSSYNNSSNSNNNNSNNEANSELTQSVADLQRLSSEYSVEEQRMAERLVAEQQERRRQQQERLAVLAHDDPYKEKVEQLLAMELTTDARLVSFLLGRHNGNEHRVAEWLILNPEATFDAVQRRLQ